ncbi:uncharacterized protein LOC135203936 [Macrobrachium nipponense]|uniref:uncharacterized protein LOC135203936 n=1 Tax=Macrobrachium nipponense TaxID=159736 RepID=UPI0030C84A57
MNWLATKLEDRGHQVVKELHISTSRGLRKPDLTVWNNHAAGILDVQIVRDSNVGSLNHLDEIKIRKFNSSEITSKVAELTGHTQTMGAITINWRGVTSKRAVVLLKKLGLRNADLNIMILKAMEGGLSIYSNYMGMAGGGDVT